MHYEMKHIRYLLSVYFLFFLMLPGRTSAQKFNSGRIGVELSSIGKISVFSPNAKFQRQVYRISLLVGADKDHVFTYIEDQDSLSSSRNIFSSNGSDYEIFGSINNSFSKQPPDVIARFNIFGWKDEAFTLVKVTLFNNDTFLKDIDAFIGFEFLPQIDSAFQFTKIKYHINEKVTTALRTPSSTCVGIKMLNDNLYSLRLIDWKDYYERGSGSDSLIYSLMSSNIIDTILTSGQLGASCLLSQEKVHLKLYDSTTVYLAIALGSNEAEVLSNINNAERKLQIPLSVEKGISILQPEFKLDQNYPNPFNSSTNITFSLPQKDHVTLKIYDILGREIRTIINSELETGIHNIKFSGHSLPSGTYFYRLGTSTTTKTLKMKIMN